MAAGRQAKLGTDGSGTRKTLGVIDGQDELQSSDRPNSADLAKPYRFGIPISSEMFDRFIEGTDLLVQVGNRFQQGRQAGL
jgi:hypothetical protein